MGTVQSALDSIFLCAYQCILYTNNNKSILKTNPLCLGLEHCHKLLVLSHISVTAAKQHSPQDSGSLGPQVMCPQF